MSIAAEKVAEVLALPKQDRAYPARQLIASLDDTVDIDVETQVGTKSLTGVPRIEEGKVSLPPGGASCSGHPQQAPCASSAILRNQLFLYFRLLFPLFCPHVTRLCSVRAAILTALFIEIAVFLVAAQTTHDPSQFEPEIKAFEAGDRTNPRLGTPSFSSAVPRFAFGKRSRGIFPI